MNETTPPIMTINDELLAELEASANAATPGPWGWDGPVWGYDSENEAPWLVQELGIKSVITGELSCNEKDASFIATCNPATILALLNHIRTMQQELKAAHISVDNCELFRKDAERYRWLRDECVCDDIQNGLYWLPGTDQMSTDEKVDAAMAASHSD